MNSDSGRRPASIGALRKQIEDNLVTSTLNQRFLPADRLDAIFSLDAIKGAVRELSCGPHELINLADKIHKDGKAVFAMLTYNRFENYIVEFRKHGVLDRQLPLREDQAQEIAGPEDGRRLALDFQWMFLPYVFPEDMSESHFQISKQYILPFIDEHRIATGAFGVVDMVHIPPSQHKFLGQGEKELQVVRKRLMQKDQIENFEREDKCLRLLSRLGHPNIIPFLGSYTYREEHNFLFPYIGMDLGKFLKATERYKEFQRDVTFYSALTGLASALSNTHRILLKESEHDVDFEGIGYHHDLRPPNVLVSEDTFILADFGLGSLKDSAALSHTPYKIITGDYIAPECTDMEENPQTVNRSIDVWAFGCLILEIVTYMLKGAEGVQEFRDRRLTKGRFPQFKDAGFYQPHGEVKQEVRDWMAVIGSSIPQADLVHQLFQLSMPALQVKPSQRCTMDEMHDRLEVLSLLKYFEAIQSMFQQVCGAEDESEALRHHLGCLKIAQKCFEIWGQLVGLNETDNSGQLSTSYGGSVKMLRSLHSTLLEEPNRRALGDPTALRPLEHQIDRTIKELWDALPAHLLSSAQKMLEDKASVSRPSEQALSSSEAGIDYKPHTSSPSPSDALLPAFEKEWESFKDRLPSSVPWNDVIKTTSVGSLYDVTDRLQTDVDLRDLSKIRPLLERLQSYGDVVQDSIRGCHGILTLLWGPLALLLQWSSENEKAYSSIIDAAAEVGKALPDFKASRILLDHAADSREILLLFFKDILDVYLVALTPFSRPGWIQFFERSWPKYSALVSKITDHIEHLSRSMTAKVPLEHFRKDQEFRKNVLEAFKVQEKRTQKTEFRRVETSLKPYTFSHILYQLSNDFSSQSGDWVFQNETYTRWLDGSQVRSRVLWLRGIPGGGKTVLSFAVFDHLKRSQLYSTGSAFLTYENEDTTAISIIHCLIFQLAEGSDERMGIICESTSDDLKSDLAATKDLLISLVHHCGPVCLVVDGLDEICSAERVRLVRQLLSVAEVCERLRILLSSRPEADLKGILEQSAAQIHIHDHNEASISAYITQRSQQMFKGLRVPRQGQVEIRRLLARVPNRAKGMFLYARLTMDIVSKLNDLSEIQDELTVLPESLDDAYLRIIKRLIQGKEKHVVEKALRLLGWVACTPSPLTVEEAGQALSLRPDKRDQVYRPWMKLDAVDLLGPIVETVDGCIRFVHFTAREYILSTHLGPQLIDTNKATLDLAIRCIDYVCQRHHDVDLSPEEVSNNVLTGQYSFHAFSIKMWFELSCQLLRSTSGPNAPVEFVESLQRLWHTRRARSSQIAEVNTAANLKSDEDVGSYEASKDQIIFNQLKGEPVLHQLLCDVLRFRNSSAQSTGITDQDLQKNEGDPLTTSEMSQRVHRAFNQVLCGTPCGTFPDGRPGCHEKCADVLYYYGTHPFKCAFLHCKFWRHGFETRSLRNEHGNSHDLPLKCHVAGCVLGKTGFLSEKMRQKHLQKDHVNNTVQQTFNTQNIPMDDVKPLLLELVRQDRVNDATKVMKTYFSAFTSQEVSNLQKLAAHSASRGMLEVFQYANLSKNIPQFEAMDECIIESIKGRNMGTLEYLLTNSTPLRYQDNSIAFASSIDIMCEVVLSDWPEGTKAVCRWHLLTPIEGGLRPTIKVLLLEKSVIRQAATHPAGDQQLILIWSHPAFLPRFVRPQTVLSDMLKAVAASSCSITLAKYLLEKGADIDGRIQPTRRTALHHAAGHKNARAAGLMEFLLLNGADPEADMKETSGGGRKGRKIRDEVGPLHISTWLGKNWDELVEETRLIRQGNKEVGNALLAKLSK